MQVEWPLSLVVDEWSLGQYQLLMRHLFELETVERALHDSWRVYQGTRGLFRRELLRGPGLRAPSSRTRSGARGRRPEARLLL